MFRRIQVIINPASGGNLPVLKILNSAFRPYGLRWDVSVTNQAGDGFHLARQAVAAGVDLVAACGGDGTIREVAAGLAGSGVPLAILPGGVGNVMAAELGIPRRLRRAARLVGEGGRLRALDLGCIGQQAFLMRASVGFEAEVAEKTSREMKDRFGLLAYGIAVVQALTTPQTARYRLTLDGQQVEAEGFSLLIANAGSIGRLNLSLADSIQPDDGLLDVMVIDTALAMAARIARLDEPWVSPQHWKARRVSVVAEPPQHVQVDGDPLGSTPITVSVLPQAVPVLVPDVPRR